MTISVGQRSRGAGPRAARFYRTILAEVEGLETRDQMAVIQALTTGQEWHDLPDAVQTFVTHLLQWVIDDA